MAGEKRIKPKKCRNPSCKQEFQPARPLQIACSVSCAVAISRIKNEQNRRKDAAKQRQEVKDERQRLKTRRDYIKEADAAFSAYIRSRDKNLPCICCGEPLGSGNIGGGFDAGHFISRRHFGTRWNELNVWGQRKYCNRYLHGNVEGFRQGLLARIGERELERLIALGKEEVKFTIQDIIEIRDKYRQKLKFIESENIA